MGVACSWMPWSAGPHAAVLSERLVLYVECSNSLGQECWLFFNGGGPAMSIPAYCDKHLERVEVAFYPDRFEVFSKKPCLLLKQWSETRRAHRVVVKIDQDDILEFTKISAAVKIQKRFREVRARRRHDAAVVLQNRIARPLFEKRTKAARVLQACVRPWLDERLRVHLLLQTAARAWLYRRKIECPICSDTLPRGFFTYMSTSPATSADLDVTRGRYSECCRSCARRYLQLQLGEGKFVIKCPLTGAAVPEERFAAIVGAQALRKLTDNRNISHQHRFDMVNDGAEGKEFADWCRTHARACPTCHVLIFRYAGCDHMACRCGMHFNWSQAPMISA